MTTISGELNFIRLRKRLLTKKITTMKSRTLFVFWGVKVRASFFPKKDIKNAMVNVKSVNFKKLRWMEINPGRIFSAKIKKAQAKKVRVKISPSNL